MKTLTWALSWSRGWREKMKTTGWIWRTGSMIISTELWTGFSNRSCDTQSCNTEPTCSQHHKHPCFSLQSDFVVDTSLVGTVLNGLSHLRGVRERGQFVVGLIRGLGGNLMLKCHQEFAKEVRAALIYGKCNFMPAQPCCPSLNLGAALLD